MTEARPSRLKALFGGHRTSDSKRPLSERQREKLLAQLRECASGIGGEVSARQRAARLGESYLELDDAGRHAFLRLIATEFGPDPKDVEKAHTAYQSAIGGPGEWDAEAGLRAAMRSARIRILTQFNALPQGVKFLVDLRSDLLRFLTHDPELAALDRELENRLTAWFDVGFLELRRITWQSPAALLEKLITYEAVHAIGSWNDLKNRLDSDRRCYAFFHPRMPDEPLIFVEVALVGKLADSVQELLDVHAPVHDPQKASTAIFYSISNTQPGLRGVSFGNFLLKKVVDDLQRDLPQLKQFATLSPIPRFRAWLEKHPDLFAAAFPPDKLARIAKLATIEAQPEALQQLLKTHDWAQNRRLAHALVTPMQRLAAYYLTQVKSHGRPYDPVARFHLGNGARIERLNFLGDSSENGLAQSYGMMVNYLYDPKQIENNVESLLREAHIAASGSVRFAAKIEAA